MLLLPAIILKRLPSSVTGTSMGIANTGGQLAGFITPLAIGYIVQTFNGSYNAAFWMLIVFAVICTVSLLTLNFKKGELLQDDVVSSTTAVYSNETYEGQPEWDMWKTTTNGKTEYILVKETEEGLYSGFPYSHYYADLKYPLFAGKVWDNTDEQAELVTYTVVATDRIVTVQAGTFENVVEVKTSDGWIFYYAPNIGLIMSIDGGIVVSELSSLQDE